MSPFRTYCIRSSLLILLTQFCAFLVPILYSQNSLFKFDRITTAEGLSHNDVWSITQDSLGFMWFGTQDGLNRYDGRSFRAYRHDVNDSTSLYSNWITSVFTDKYGTLWVVATMLHRYNSERDNFERIPLDSTEQRKITAYKVYCDSDGLVWVGTSKGIIRYDPTRKRADRVYFGFDSAEPSGFDEDHNDHIWLSFYEQSGRIFKVNKSDLTHTVFEYKKGYTDGLPNAQFQALAFDEDDSLYVAGGGEVFIYDWKSNKTYKTDLLTRIPRSTFVLAINFQEKGKIWMGSWNRGILLVDKPQNRLYHRPYNSSDPHSINSQSVHQLYHDDMGNLWCATLSGIAKKSRWHKAFSLYTHNTENPKSLYEGEVKSIIEDKDSNLWISIMFQGLIKLDASSGQFTKLNEPAIPTVIQTLFKTPDEVSIFWSVRYQGLFIFKTAGNELAKKWIDRQPDSWKNLLLSYLEEKDGTKWYGTYAGLLREEASGLRTWYEKDDSNAMKGNSICELYQDRSGSIWVATDEEAGLMKYETHSKKLIPIQRVTAKCFALHEDRSGNLWLATSGAGMGYYDRDRDTVFYLTTKDGLSSNVIYGILEDDSGNLWLATNKDISKYDPKRNVFTNYGIDDGIPAPERLGLYAFNAFCRTKRGEMVFGLGSRGFIIFHPDSIRHNPSKPRITFTEFMIDNQIIRPSDLSPLKKEMARTEEIQLNHLQNNFSLQFAALDYTSPEKNNYSYKLDGFDNDWAPASTRNIAYYTNVPPGTYAFCVRGTNSDGVWNEEGASIRIIISPPWWKTVWAYFAYFCLVAGIYYFIRKYEFNRQRLKHELELEHLGTVELKEVDEMKSRFFANISHEFRTPLTLIEGPLKQLISHDFVGDTHTLYHMMLRNSRRLMHLVNQLLDLAKLEEGHHTLKIRYGNISNAIRHIAASFESLAVSRSILYKINIAETALQGWFDRDVLEKIVINLLSNAFKFTPEGGDVSLSLSAVRGSANNEMPGTPEKIELTVSDSGIGIPEKDLDHIFDRFYQADAAMTREYEGTGIGLALAKELAELHAGQISVISEAGKGSSFKVHLSVGKEAFRPDQIDETTVDPDEALQIPPDQDAFADRPNWHNHVTGLSSAHRLLIIDDNADMRQHLRSILQAEYSIHEAGDGQKGIEYARKLVPDLIISDVMMPVMDGLTLCRRIKTDILTSHIPVILLTARADSDHKIEGLETGADDYLIKPFDARELLVRIKNLIAQRIKLQESIRAHRLSETPKLDISPCDQKFLSALRTVIEKRLADSEFDMVHLAKQMAMSRMNLHRKVKALTGYSPGEFSHHYRLERAADMLKQKSGNVTQVAYDVGFNSLSYFAKAFREKYGVNPSDF